MSENENDSFRSLIEGELKNVRVDNEKIRPLALAYLGDTLLDLYVRSRLVMSTQMHPKDMHRSATQIVNAASQAKMMKHLLDLLSEEEKEVFRHARNQRPGTIPKNQSPVDYKWATGLEALMGYLYLNGRESRMYELMQEGCSFLEREKKSDNE